MIKEFKDLVGCTFIAIEGCEPKSQVIVFYHDDESESRLYHSQDCCETVEVNDVVGDVKDLMGTPILLAEECTEQEGLDTLWTFYKLSTIKGSVTIRWYGDSEYYSTDVYFSHKAKMEVDMTWEPKQGDMIEVCSMDNANERWYKHEFVYYINKPGHLNPWVVISDEGCISMWSYARPIKPKEHEITVGSVWEKDGALWVATYQQNNGFFCLFSPLKNDEYPHIDSVLIKDFIPRPDKIGMAPCLMKYQSDESLFCISNRLFRSNANALDDDALDYYNNGKFWFFSWPANNSMWVIVDK